MKISYQWLKKYLPELPSPEKTASLLTQSGLEVNKVSPFQFLSPHLVIGKVLTCCNHPHANKLKKTTVDIGVGKPLNIICGATNVSIGQKVIVAPIGTTLTLSKNKILKIKKVKIRNEVSEGMICAEEEINLAKTQKGVLTLDTKQQSGMVASLYFNTPPDSILDIELTPNRSDAFSHVGIARELGILIDKELEEPIIQPLVPVAEMLSLQISVKEPTACSRYTGIILKNIQLAPSPIWLQNRLKSIGMTPVNNVVDIANFVMYELGQPLHVFDYKKLASKKIIIKKLPPRTSFTDLNGVTRELNGDELMVCDKSGPLCMAGIIGGERGKIEPTTRTIFLESAYFEPTTIAKATQYHNLHTEASFRFERGTDPNLPRLVLQRATNLLQKITQCTIASDIIEYYPHEIKPIHITTTYTYIDKIIGISLFPNLIHSLLKKLDINIKEATDEGFTAVVPTYRVDVKRPSDLVEEIMRIYGYNNLPNEKTLRIPCVMQPLSYEKDLEQKQQIATFLATQGYNQIITNPLTKSSYTKLDKLPIKDIFRLENPLTEHLDSLRHTLLFTGLETVAYNLNHGQDTLKLFELGKIYKKEQEYQKIGLWLVGDIEAPNWIRKPRKVNLQDLYAIIHLLLQYCGISHWEAVSTKHSLYQACLTLYMDQKPFLHMGQINATILKTMQVNPNVFFAEIDTQILLRHKAKKINYLPIAKYPPTTRDLSLAVGPSITFEQIRTVIKQQNISQIKTFYLIDYYQGKQLDGNRQSYTLHFILQDSKKTLKAQHANKIIDQVIQALHNELKAVVR